MEYHQERLHHENPAPPTCRHAVHGCVLDARPGVNPVTPTAATFAPDQIDQLLGPIALYPDSLLALILPASTSPVDVVLAARYLAAGGDPGQIDQQPWDESVRALTRYPEVLRWMDANLAWTAQLGRVFAAQPTEAMVSIQHLRAQASWAGTLNGSAEQTVIYEGGVIRIVPVQAGVIYLPIYDPEAVYGLNSTEGQSTVSFIAVYHAGLGLNFEFDWNRRTLWVADGRPPGGGQRLVVDQIGRRPGPERHAWQPASIRGPAPTPESDRTRVDLVRPTPLRSTPVVPTSTRSSDRGRSDPASRAADSVPRSQPDGVGPPAAVRAVPLPDAVPRASRPVQTADPATSAVASPASRNQGNTVNRAGGSPPRSAPAAAASTAPAAPLSPPATTPRESRPQTIRGATPAAPEAASPAPPEVRSKSRDESTPPAGAGKASAAVPPPAAAPPAAARDFRPSPTRPNPTTPPVSAPAPPSLGRERAPAPAATPAPPPAPSASMRPGPPPAPPAPAPATTPADDKKKKE